jgi:hypothetical protein
MTHRTIHNLSAFGYNPSICEFAGTTWLAYRWHSRGDWRTSLALATLDDQLNSSSNKPIVFPSAIETQSIEDPHLFVYKNDLWMSFIVSKWPSATACAYVGYGRLIQIDGKWHIAGFHRVYFGRNRQPNSMEKNWLFFAHENYLYSIYNCGTQQTVLRIQGESVNDELQSPALQWNYGTEIGRAHV